MISKLELRRQFFHMICGVVFVVLIYHNIVNVIFLIALLVLGFILSALYLKYKIKIIHWFLERFDRPEDIATFPGKGPIFLVFGILLSVLLFEKDVALASIMVLALGDTFGAIIGPFGSIRHPRPFSQEKFIEGSVMAIIAGFVGAIIFVRPLEAFFASLIAILVEVAEIKMLNEKIDDNILIPLIAGAVITLMRVYL